MIEPIEKPWVALRDVHANFGVTYLTAKNKIQAGTFDVPTYKVGKTIVIDRAVYDEFFRRQRACGLAALASTASG